MVHDVTNACHRAMLVYMLCMTDFQMKPFLKVGMHVQWGASLALLSFGLARKESFGLSVLPPVSHPTLALFPLCLPGS